MTTQTFNKPRTYEGGSRNSLPVISDDIIYEGAAIGLVPASGHARPLTSVDVFGGFAEAKADNSGGGAAAINVETIESGKILLPVTGVTITDTSQPVYATDDDTFTMSPVGGVFVGFVHRFVASGQAIVAFDALNYRDPYAAYGVREAITGNKTLDIQDNGKMFWVTDDALVVTMPATATPVNCLLVNGGSYGTQSLAISPNSSDKIQGPDLPGTDDHDLINTKATAQRGDRARMVTGDANGPIVAELVGIWATA